MTLVRRQTLWFILSAFLIVGAGYAAGYAHAYAQFYSPEALLDRELLHMDFNSRLLHHTILNQQADCRRELVQALQGELTYVDEQINAGLPSDSQTMAIISVEHARTVLSGHALAQSQPQPPQPEKERD